MRKNLIINQTFSRGVGTWYEPNYIKGAMSVVKSPVRESYPYSLKCVFKRGGETNRSEIGTDPLTNSKTEAWVGMSILFPSDYVIDNVDYSIFQFQASPDKNETWGNPPFSFLVSGDNLKVDYRTDATAFNPTKQMGVADSIFAGKVTPGKWMDIVVHIKWSYQGEGALQVWLNNQIAIERRNISIGYNDANPHYFKFGMYSWNNANSNKPVTTLYYTAVRLGNELANYNDVYPGKVLVSTTNVFYDGSKEKINY